MTYTSYPFDNQDTTESQFSALFKELQDTGVVGALGDTGFAVSTNGAGLDVQIAAGFAIVRGHAVSSDAVETVTLAAANASNPRIDLVVLRLDPTVNNIGLVVIQGTPAAAPVAPALTQTTTGLYDLPLASIVVGANALNITTGNITDVRTFVGQRTGQWTTATRPTARKYKLGYNETTSAWEWWNGSAWIALVDGTAYATKAQTVEVVNAKGDLLVGTAPDTLGRLGVGTDGQVLLADAAQATGLRWGAVPGSNLLCKVKSAATSRTSTTVLAADPHLSLAVEPGAYRFRLWLRLDNATGLADLKLRLATPAGTTAVHDYWVSYDATSAPSREAAWAAGATVVRASSGPGNSELHGALVVPAAGIVALEWAQNTSNAEAVSVLAGSSLTLERSS